MKNNSQLPLTDEDLRPYWRGTVIIHGAEELSGGLGARRSFTLEGQTLPQKLTIEFPWLKRSPRGKNGYPIEIENPEERIKKFTIYGASPEGTYDLRLHCGDTILVLKHR
ncbi:MAG: hypothetical protein UX30_C0013G0007 [Candidatus Saccharibacteria bacterium GW2011_GWA2_46_10]|nr:MAG: hypothetical protein UX30_C0013G0007 [Candidatus Saccharibacteria bacterium GW2011_GWA2_46_10]